jgi:hypothetical protein
LQQLVTNLCPPIETLLLKKWKIIMRCKTNLLKCFRSIMLGEVDLGTIYMMKYTLFWWEGKNCMLPKGAIVFFGGMISFDKVF